MNKLKKILKNSSPDHCFLPLWFWNHELDKTELQRQINFMLEQKVGGFVIYPRHGLRVPYLSESWFDKMAFVFELAQKNKLSVFINDEYNWPSGAADGQILQDPDCRMAYLYLYDETTIKGSKSVEKYVPSQNIELIQAIRVNNGELDLNSVKNLKKYLKNDRFHWHSSEGEWKIIFVGKEYFNSSFFGYLPDYLNPKVAKQFIRIVYESYKKHLKKYFGNTLKGFITEKPGLGYFNHTRAIPWSPHIFRLFNRQNSLNLEKHIGGLFFNAGKKTQRIRTAFRALILDEYVNNFIKPLTEWCKKEHLLSIGQLQGEGPLEQNILFQGNYFDVMRHFDIAAVDSPDSQLISNQRNIIATKMGSSSAALYSKSSVMTQIFRYADGWKFNLRLGKWLADWQVILGATSFMPYAFFYSVQGFRKFESTPDIFFRQPYWKFFDQFTNYLSQLSSLFSQSQRLNNIAVLYPHHSLWAKMNFDSTNEAKIIANEFLRTF